MRQIKVIIAALLLSPFAANATIIGFDLTYSQVNGDSVGVGMVSFDDSLVTPNNNVFTNGSFLESFMLDFSGTGFQDNDSVSFGLADVGAAFLLVDEFGIVSQINIWTYDRIAIGRNDCPPCTEIYLAGFAPHVAMLTDPNTQTILEYNFTFTPKAVPEPGTLALLGISLFGMGLARRKG